MSSEDLEAEIPSINEKITKYEHFVNEVLRNDLKKVLKRSELIEQQLSDYLQIKSMINGIQQNLLVESNEEPLKVQTDIGSNFYVECVVPNPQKIYLTVGMGFYIEYTLEEAVKFIDKKEKQLNEELNQLSGESSKIKANIKLVLHTIGEINNL